VATLAPVLARGAGARNKTPQPIARGAGVDQTSSQIRVKARCCLPQPRLVNVRATVGNFEGVLARSRRVSSGVRVQGHLAVWFNGAKQGA
jgi:hypothetical protein